MAEYLIQEETLTGLGDKIRVLSGTTGTMTPAEMQSDLDTFNSDMGTVVTDQDSLIAQISAALEGKTTRNDMIINKVRVLNSESSLYPYICVIGGASQVQENECSQGAYVQSIGNSYSISQVFSNDNIFEIIDYDTGNIICAIAFDDGNNLNICIGGSYQDF